MAQPLRQRQARRAAGDSDEPRRGTPGDGRRETGAHDHASPGAHTSRLPAGGEPGLAVDVEKKDGSRALVVPVIRHAERMDFAAFHATYEALVDKARTNKLLPDDFAGATITLTNPGTIGTVASVPRLM